MSAVQHDAHRPADVPPIEPQEELLRRVPPSYYPDPERAGTPKWIAFQPTRDDADGLSLNRRRFVTSLEDFSYNPPRTKRRSIAQIRAARILELGLHVEPRPENSDPGHAVVPEMNRTDYDAGGQKKAAIKEWALNLARACKMVLVLDQTQAE